MIMHGCPRKASGYLAIIVALLLIGCSAPQSSQIPLTLMPAAETPTISPRTPIPITPTVVTERSPQTPTPVPFTVYVPTSDQMRQTSAHIQDDGSRTLVELRYQDAQEQDALFVLNGKEHCCLDAAGKAVNPVMLASDDTAYYLPNQPIYGGDILWWVHNGTYIALSGPHLTKDILLQLANTIQPLSSNTVTKLLSNATTTLYINPKEQYMIPIPAAWTVQTNEAGSTYFLNEQGIVLRRQGSTDWEASFAGIQMLGRNKQLSDDTQYNSILPNHCTVIQWTTYQAPEMAGRIYTLHCDNPTGSGSHREEHLYLPQNHRVIEVWRKITDQMPSDEDSSLESLVSTLQFIPQEEH